MDYMTFINENWAWIIMIINGLVAGWLAGLLLGGGGLIRNLFVGLIGAVVGGWLFNAGYLPVTDYYDFNSIVPTYGNQIAVSTVGAILVVIVARFLGGR
ncbi:MAG TPA: GlsB/YeaQ/YmgE family stress response membrane protein [Hyphomicrobiaceae bacterium]|nr:GlsB/YeaQ/YmgE family stress response membrane protein [Hyphomicrobiaceae bacterium]